VTFENQRRKFALAVVFLALALALPLAQSQEDREERTKEAASQSAKASKVFDAIMKTPDKAIPRELLEHAKAIAVFPQASRLPSSSAARADAGL
jgi:lipid-binding SYLF domain-containing protein